MTGPRARAIHAGGPNARYFERRSKKPKKPAAGAQLTSLVVGRLYCPKDGPESLFTSRRGVASCCHCGYIFGSRPNNAASFNGRPVQAPKAIKPDTRSSAAPPRAQVARLTPVYDAEFEAAFSQD
jgi:hypothetical protein